jgi:multiple sugar transport system permease protein
MKEGKSLTKEEYTWPEIREATSFLLPLFGFIFIFILIPVLGTLVTSLYEDVSFLPGKFVFLSHYKRLFSDPLFWRTLRFTLLFVVVSVLLETLSGLMLALILNLNIPGRGTFRACILIPWVIPSAISARTWELIYNYHYGLANFAFLKLGLSSQPLNWLGTSMSAFISLVMADVWKTTPFVAIILLAGLQAIPQELYSQAKVDRANFLQIFSGITLPLLKPIIIVALLFRTIDALRIFDLIYVLTGGGPGGSTTSLSLYAYKYFASGDFGYGSTLSVILFVIALLFSIFYLKSGRFTDHVFL